MLTSQVFVQILDRNYEEITNNFSSLSLSKLNYIQTKINTIIQTRLNEIVNKYNNILKQLISGYDIVNGYIRVVDRTIVLFVVPQQHSCIGVQINLDGSIYTRKVISRGNFTYVLVNDFNDIETKVLWKDKLIVLLSDLYNEINGSFLR